jgi:hypothetical protein
MDTRLIIKEDRSRNKIFLNEKYDSAILWINHTTGSVIYSLTMLIHTDIEDLGREGLLEYMPEGQRLIQFLSNNFLLFFEILQKTAEGIPPSLHYDVIDRLGLAAA